ncbi:MAG: hypothetical protein R3282_01030 [Rhodothermales bacterium]|nr:hypothetical protein [Rhodothermales bacterium]
MSLFRRTWSPIEADEWTREDYAAIVISPVAYMLLMVGVALSFMLRPIGFLLLAGGVVLTVLMHWIIDPKLRAVSEEYERKQNDYLKELEASTRWQSPESESNGES